MAILDVRGFGLDVVTAPQDVARGIQQGVAISNIPLQRKQALLDLKRQEEEGQVRGIGLDRLRRQEEVRGAFTPQDGQQLTEQEMIDAASKIDPFMAKQALAEMGMDTPAKIAEASRFAARIASLPPELQDQAIRERVVDLESRYGKGAAKDTAELEFMDPNQRAEALLGMQLIDLSTRDRLQFAQSRAESRAQKSGPDFKSLEFDLKRMDKKFDQASKLRGEIDKLSTSFRSARSAWQRVQASSEDPSPAGDLALIFNFMKVLDPGSTVREGEFAQVGAAGNLPTQVQRRFDQWATGEKLTAEQRNDVVDRAEKLYKKQAEQNKIDIDRSLRVGKRFGIEKEDILGVEPEAAPGRPSLGAADGMPEGAIAVNPATGQEIIVVNGNWVEK